MERERGERENKILVKSPKPRNKAYSKVDFTKFSIFVLILLTTKKFWDQVG